MNIPTRILAGALLMLSLAACQNHASTPQADSAQPMQLKLYKVPPQKSDALLTALRGTIMNGSHGRVTQPFPGTLLVAAPAAEQASIADVIGALSKAHDQALPHAQYEVHFWLVDMLPGNGPDTTALEPLSATLDSLRKRLGPAHFVLADSAMAITTSGHHAANDLETANRHDFEFWIPSTSTGQVQLALRYIDRTGAGFRALKTSASMPLGDYVVLAQAAAPRHMPDHAAPPPKGAMRLLVVRVDKLAPPATR